MECCDWDRFENQDDLERECHEILSKAEFRRYQGAKEYVHDGFFLRDVFDDIEEELLDTINYCIFQIIKTRQTKKKLTQATEEAEAKLEMVGKTANVIAKFTQSEARPKIKIR